MNYVSQGTPLVRLYMICEGFNRCDKYYGSHLANVDGLEHSFGMRFAGDKIAGFTAG